VLEKEGLHEFTWHNPSLEVSGMNKQMECMCLNCGVSLYLSEEKIFLEEIGGTNAKLLKDVSCAECGGSLILIGEAGAEPYYRLE
jgi:hypothetical protein